MFLLTGGLPLLFMRCILVATVNGAANVLIDGVITQNEIAPGDSGSNSTLSLFGRDLTALMDQTNWSGFPFPACPSEARVALLLAKYAFFGLLPVIIPSILIDIELPIDRIPAQQGSDLQYIRQLAEETGYVFFIAAGPAPGTSTAYWGPQVKIGPVQPALNIDMDAYTNVEIDALQVRSGEEQDPTGVYVHRADRNQHSDPDSAHQPAAAAIGRRSRRSRPTCCRRISPRFATTCRSCRSRKRS